MATSPKPDATNRPMSARLACGCQVGFRPGVEGSPVSVVVERKSASCGMPIHVAGLAVYDHREAIRPPTRVASHVHSDHEES